MGTLHPSAASSAASPHTRASASSPIQELVPSGAFAFCNPPEPDLKEIVEIMLRKVLKLPEEEEGLPTPPPSSPTPLPPAPATSPAESWIAFSGGFALGFSTGTWFGYWLGKKKRVQPQKQGLLCIYSPPSSVLHRRISTDAHLYTI